MKPGADLNPPGALVRRNDPDRFLATLFAPASARETLFVLYAFNLELARACEAPREPHASLIRLAWWREVVEGAARRHEVATPLAASLAEGRLDRAALLALIDARESEVAPEFATLADWRAHLIATQGGLAAAAGKVLGAEGAAPALRFFGAAYGAARLLGSIPALARRGRVLLPADILAAYRLSPEAVIATPDAPALAPVRARLASEAATWLAEARRSKLPRAALPAALPAVLAARDLRRPGETPRPRGLGARLSVLMAALRGRV